MPEKKTLTQQIEMVNAQLRDFGRAAIQEVKMVKNGQIIGQIRYGYKPQYVFDAVNAILMPENWRYEVVSKEIFDNQVVAEVKLFIRVKDEWFCKGAQSGQMQIVRGNVGDAMKGAITDAIQKCLSLLSIGSDAYKGLLQAAFHANNGAKPQAAPQRQKQNKPNNSSKQKPTNNGNLPKIAGIKYQQRNGIVVATGNAYDKRELLKSAGFRWDKSDKNWFKELSVQ